MAEKQWWNDYVGLPYVAKGRDRLGVDCWGLVRLVYGERFDIELPSLSEHYDGNDTEEDDAKIAELIAVHKEGWVQSLIPQSGDVVLMRNGESQAHVGVITQPGFFLHVRLGRESVVERLDSPLWRDRVIGTFRYAESASAIAVSACPHPLKQMRIDSAMPEGTSLADMAQQIRAGHGVSDLIGDDAIISVDGEYIPRDRWAVTVPRAGSCVEYRAVAGKGGTGRMLAMIAVMVLASFIAPFLAVPFIQGMSLTAATMVVNGITIGLTMAGMMLVNAIFPVRQPKNPGQAERQTLLQGGQNQGNPYGAIPSVLGRFRFTPPLGAQTYVESDATDSYLRMLLVWGYGPMQVSDLRVGTTPLDALEEVEYETLTGWEDTPDDVARFNTLYGKDVSQTQPNLLLVCFANGVTSATRSANVVTVVTSDAHDYSAGWSGYLTGVDGLGGTISEVVNSTTFRFPHNGVDGAIAGVGTAYFSPWTEHVISSECSRISVALHFPEGLRQMPVEGGNSGKIDAAIFRAAIQVRQLDKDTLLPLTSWGDVNVVFHSKTVNLTPAWFNTDSDAALEKVYRWTRISINENNVLVVRNGAMSTLPDAPPSGTLLTRLQNDSFGLGVSFDLLPAYGPSEEPLWDICMFGDSVYSTVDKRGTGTAGVTGCGLTISGYKATIADGTLTRAQADFIRYGASGEPWYKRKDAFTTNISFSVPKGIHEVRVRRTNDSEKSFKYPSGNDGIRYHDAYVSTITGYENTRPIVAPPGVKLAMTAIRVRATNQLNGSIEGINGTVQIICKDWDHTTSTWIVRPTRNPASLMRHVLQHVSNAQRVPDSQIDLVGLADWHNYCRTNKFMFDAVLTQHQALLDTLRDIAAAGRASPTKRDGKWTVIIDRPRSTIVQYFTPHNSSGFEGARVLSKLPHAFRVQFNNAEKGYQPDEMIVYNDGYTSANATLFEGLALPGVTLREAVFKHARMHFAQLKLRPETYNINVDNEHLACTRGDLVRVLQTTALWGLGSGRIKNYISTYVVEVDEPMYFEVGVSYTVRIRLANGSSITRTTQPFGASGYQSIFVFLTTITAEEGAPGNLFMFGELSSESVEMIVQSIEPMDKLTARLTLVDYSPAVYDSDLETIPAFDSQITLPPALLANVIQYKPTITKLVSDESVMQKLSTGSYAYRIKAVFLNPKTLPSMVDAIEGQIDFSGDASLNWSATRLFKLSDGAVFFDDVEEGETYRVRLRYVDGVGRSGPWTAAVLHTVVGKTTQPSKITGLTATPDGTKIRLDWADSPEADVVKYEVRTADSGWGDVGQVFRGLSSTCLVAPDAPGVQRTWYVKAIDAAGLYSKLAASVSYTAALPTDVTLLGVTHSFYDTSETNATITIDWVDVAPAFGLKGYQISYGSVVKNVSASTITLPADWVGVRTFTIRARDNLGNLSAGIEYSVTKSAPDTPRLFRAKVIDNTVMLYWDAPPVTSLPVSHFVIKRGDTWDGATLIGKKSGEFTTVNETVAGTYTYWIAAVDTDAKPSTPASISVKVNEPPDFVFHGSLSAEFDGTLTNAYLENGAIILPVNTTQTFEQHFTAPEPDWATPDAQIAAGYPHFAQPGMTTGSYMEVFDLGTVLSASIVNLTWIGVALAGSPSVTPKIELSGSLSGPWDVFDNATDVFGTEFRYVRVTLTVTGDDHAIYSLSAINVSASVKTRNDGGSVSCLSTDTNGTLVNFNKEFIDVTSITVSPAGTTPISVVRDFLDAVLAGTYSVVSNVATLGITAHGLVVGQKVRLSFTSGGAPSGVYTVTAVDSVNQFKVAITTANTSGNVSAYHQGMRVYLFNSTTGVRVSATASWALKGY